MDNVLSCTDSRKVSQYPNVINMFFKYCIWSVCCPGWTVSLHMYLSCLTGVLKSV